MSHPLKTYIPWRDRAFLTPDEVAAILARSPDWVRARVSEGQLEGLRLLKGGPLVVTVASVADLVARVLEPECTSRTPPRPRTYPRLAWSQPSL